MRPSFLCMTVVCLLLSATSVVAENWPCWRGPRGDGTVLDVNAPVVWDGESGQNIAWKIPVPGSGHSSPVIWQDRVFLTSCKEKTQERLLTCIDRH